MCAVSKKELKIMSIRKQNGELIALVADYVKGNIAAFHRARVNKLGSLRLDIVLKKKNPYLFKAKNLLTVGDIVRSLTDAFLSSAEETIFGDWLEGLALFVCEKVYGGRKSTTRGIDLEFDKGGKRYIVSVKSGPNWGNSSQISKMREDFKAAAKTLRTSRSGLSVVAVNGCCYGKDNHPDKGDYYKFCGQDFWYFISGEETLYTDILEPLATDAKRRNEEFRAEYARLINKLTKEFTERYCDAEGNIDWAKMMSVNSASNSLPRFHDGGGGKN